MHPRGRYHPGTPRFRMEHGRERHERGRVSRGGTFECELKPGPCTMHLKIDWCGSNSVTFMVAPDSLVEATCGSNLRGWRVVKAGQLLLNNPDGWLWLSIAHGSEFRTASGRRH